MAHPHKKHLGHAQFGVLKRCETIGVENEDRISGLPDDILLDILTRLTLKEAMATSILSRRWEKVWESYPFLDFEDCFKDVSMETFILRVYKILEKFNGPKLYKFGFRKFITAEFSHHIDDWISFAFRNHVSELKIHLQYFAKSSNYYLPIHVFVDEIIKPKLYTSMLTNSPNGKKHFESLRDLYLRAVNISDDVFDIMLFHCSSLERLSLLFSIGLVNAKNTVPHLKLKSLVLYNCIDLEKLQLSAPNLVSFKYHGRERSLVLKDAHRLDSLCLSKPRYANSDRAQREKDVVLGGRNFVSSHFSTYLSKLESLVINDQIFEDKSDFTELCVFSNLKHLMVGVESPKLLPLGIKVAAFIIRGAPYLELLELVLPSSCDADEALKLDPMSPHQNLKEVKLYGFRGDRYTRLFLKYLVEFTVSLERVNISSYEHIMIEWKACRFKIKSGYNKDLPLCLRKIFHANTQLVYHDVTY